MANITRKTIFLLKVIDSLIEIQWRSSASKHIISYAYKILRNVIFVVFMVHLSPTKFYPQYFIGKDLACGKWSTRYVATCGM